MFHIGRPWTKQEQKKRADERKRKEKIKNREVHLDSNGVFIARFHPGRTWLLLPSPFFVPSILDSPHDLLDEKVERVNKELIYHHEGTLRRAFLRSFSKEDDLSQLEPIFKKNQSVRFSMKRLVLLWKLKRAKQMNEEDISTMEVPKKKVVVYSPDLRTKYVFEASTLLKDAVSRLTLNEEFFPKPLYPRNPFTNQTLTYGQLFSIHRQLRAHGITNWIWEAFVHGRFCLNSLLDTFSTPLKVHSIKAFFADPQEYLSQTYVADFIESRYTTKQISNIPFYMKVYDWATVCQSSHPHMLKWRSLSCRYWILLSTQDEDAADNSGALRREVLQLLKDTAGFNEMLALWTLANKVY